MFLKLNCLEKPFILMPMETSAGVYENVPIPIIGIVKELPTSVDFITTDYFYNQRIMSLNSNPFLPQEHDEIDLYIQCDSNSINKATEAIKANLEKNIKKKYDPLFSISNHTQTRFVGFNVNISLYPGTANRNDLEMLYKYIRDGYEEYNLEAFKIYQYHFNKIINENKYDMISIDFIKFNEIKKFQEYFQRKYQIKIDMSKIEQKNIYSLISSASIATSVILMCFTIFSISTYLNQYMKNYLMSNRINLGTLMAFGIANITLIQIYLYISLIYLNILTIGAFITASAIGYSGFISYMFSHIGQFQLENKIYLFSTMNIYVLCGIIVMVVCVSIPLYFNIKNVISNTPGDLINERID